MSGYRSVRALERGLAVLSCLAAHGPATPRVIATRISEDRATVYRLLQTLTQMQFVRSGSDGRYHLSTQVLDLAAGFSVHDALLPRLGPTLRDLHQAVLWPVAYASLQDTALLVEESTSSISPYAGTLLKPGTSLPLSRTSLGRAILAAFPPHRRQVLVARLGEQGGEPTTPPHGGVRLEQILRDVEQRGYGYNVGDLDSNMSGIALPVLNDGLPIGAINLVFFRKSMSVQEAADRYLPALQRCADGLQSGLSALRGVAGGALHN